MFTIFPGNMATVLKDFDITLKRIENFISDTRYTDVNLRGRSITHAAATCRVSWDDAIRLHYTAVDTGETFGPLWSTHWFRLEIDVPENWLRQEVRLRWNSGAELMVWKDGKPLQGLSGKPDNYIRTDFVLTKSLQKEECQQTIYLEMACTTLMGAGCGDLINAPDMDTKYEISLAEICIFDPVVYHLVQDMEVIHGMAKHLPRDSNRCHQALYTANKVINICADRTRASASRAREVTKEFLSMKNGHSQHTLHAMGHCHIDCAWLWSYDETIRKCGRSWASTLMLMKEYPDLTFTCSQAQQYAWVKETYSDIYEQIKVAVGNRRFIPVGGTWVEMDGNLPSGESFVRQLLYGQRFFQQEFGIKCTEFWLPDTFGYSAQLPQLISSAGMKRFLTQKLSWNAVNKFPHHTFYWEGLDGTKVLTHFPPGNSYHMLGYVEELLRTVSNFEDKGRSNSSVYLFGYGDGGGGPTEDQIERIHRMEDVDGLPRIKMSTPGTYFSEIEKCESDQLCSWKGELFLEFHQGTYTSQAKTKLLNRICETLLHDAEFLSSMATVFNKSYKYPGECLEKSWKNLLLNQFHDVLPGSSIEQVYKDAERLYKDIQEKGENIKQNALTALFKNTDQNVRYFINTLGWERVEVVHVPDNKNLDESLCLQKTNDGQILICVDVPGFGFSCATDILEVPYPVSVVKQDDGSFCMENRFLKADLSDSGHLLSLYHKPSNKEAIMPGLNGNQLVIHDDIPNYWDAWDVNSFHLQTRVEVNGNADEVKIAENGPLRAIIHVKKKISERSHISQDIILDAESQYLLFKNKVEWHENRKFLKVEFPVNVHSDMATFDIQFGYVKRPTHCNTSWDWSKFEVCGHKWADISEYDWGVSLLNDSKYGYSVKDSLITLSLLRAPKAPDEHADMGDHTFSYALMPHQGSPQTANVPKIAYNLNTPLISCVGLFPDSEGRKASWVQIYPENIILENIKKAEDSDSALVLRLYEAYGGRAQAVLDFYFPVQQAMKCNVLEEAYETIEHKNNKIYLSVKPFEVVNIMVEL